MMAFRNSVYESTGYTPQFLVSGGKFNIPIDIQYPSSEQPNKTDVHQFVPPKPVDMQRAHEVARLHLQAAQLLRIFFKILNCMAADASQVTMFGYMAL